MSFTFFISSNTQLPVQKTSYQYKSPKKLSPPANINRYKCEQNFIV